MKRLLRLFLLSTAFVMPLLPAPLLHAITFGQPDGDLHPNVGTMIVEIEGERVNVCTGTLISPTVYLTAAHCTAGFPGLGIRPDDVWVTFDSTFDQRSPVLPGTYHQDPRFDGTHFSDWHDLTVVVLDDPVTGLTPAELPPLGLLDRLKDRGGLKGQEFTAVGYGRLRDSKTGPWIEELRRTNVRHYVSQTAHTLKKAWIQMDMNPSHGNGGTCFGDSGGPHFLGGSRSNLIVATTTAGDAVCRSTDLDYRLDTRSARSFLGRYVELP